MPWYVFLAGAAVVLPSIALTVDHIRRRGLPRLPRAQVPRLGFKSGPSVPDEFYLRLAKKIVEGGFVKKPFVDERSFKVLFSTKASCLQCRGGRHSAWDLGKALRLISKLDELARQLKQGRYCLSCLEQLSDIAAVEKKHLKELGKKDPKGVPRFSLPLGRVAVVLFLAGLFAYNFAHEAMIGPAYLEGIFLWAAFGVAGLMSLQKLTRKDLFSLLVMVAIAVLVIRGLAG